MEEVESGLCRVPNSIPTLGMYQNTEKHDIHGLAKLGNTVAETLFLDICPGWLN